MNYFKVTKQKDHLYLPKLEQYFNFVQNELFTARELVNLGIKQTASFLEPFEISRNKTYWFFGARFAES